MEEKPLEVAIIGAGFSGICMGIQLRKAGISNFKIFEKTGGISGTWYDNTYPGAACDVPSHLYSFSFELNPNWSRVYSPQQEIKEYVEGCVDKHKIRDNIQQNTEVISARFDEDSALWHLHTADQQEIHARVVVSGVGGLNRPLIPNIPGLEDFSGTYFHSARWNHEHDITDKRVAVVGSAASAIQIIPQIAPKVKELCIFQRSPNYIVPRLDRPYSEERKARYRRFPFLMRLYRWMLYWIMDFRFIAFDKKENWLSRGMTKIALHNMRKRVKKKELHPILTPDYPIGCKRILVSDDFYPSLDNDHVHIITEHIERIEPNGIVTKDGKLHEVDTIVFATGFQVKDITPVDMQGLGGKELQDTWKNGPEAHRGVTVAGFPNFFILLGPNTGLGHNSIIFMIECQVNYIIKCLKKLKKYRYIDVKQDSMKNYNDYLQKNLQKTVWASSCESWYKMEDGKIHTLWPHNTVRYWFVMRRPRFSEYNLVK